MNISDTFFLGLDLGQAQDPSALCAVVKQTKQDEKDKHKFHSHYTVRGLKR